MCECPAAKPKKDEYFKRIRGSQLIELMDEEDIEVPAQMSDPAARS